MNLSNEDRAQILAMEALRKQLQDSSAADAANTQRSADDYRRQAQAIRDLITKLDQSGPAAVNTRVQPQLGDDPGAGGIESQANAAARRKQQEDAAKKDRERIKGTAAAVQANPFGRVMSEVASKFAAIVGPAAVLSQVLNNDLAGFQVLGSAVKVLAATIAPVLLPAVVAVSAGLLAMSDVVFERGMPIFEKWFEIVLGTAIPAITFLIDCFDDAADIVTGFTDVAVSAIDWINQKLNSLNPFSDAETGSFRDSLVNRGPGEDSVNRGLSDTLRSLRMSMGPRATVTGLGDVGRQVQVAALGMDPIRAREMKIQQDALNRLDRIAANTSRRGHGRSYDVDPLGTGAGDYERGTGSVSEGADYGEG